MKTVTKLEKESQAATERVKEIEAERAKIELEISAEKSKPDPLAVARAIEKASQTSLEQAELDRFMQRLEILETEADQIKKEITDLLAQGAAKVEQLSELRHKAYDTRSMMQKPPSDPKIMHRIENLKKNYQTRIG